MEYKYMRILLISANTETINMPTMPVGLGCIAAATERAGHSVMLLDLMSESDPCQAIRQTIRTLDPDLIGISIRNIDDQRMDHPKFLLHQAKETVALCRNASTVPIVLGGAGYSIFPESALGYLNADMGIRGEGEEAFPELLKRLERREGISDVPGLYVKGKGLQKERAFIEDLNACPLPGPSVMPIAKIDPDAYWLPFQTRRGCPLNCSYCSTSAIEGRRIRRRSLQTVVDGLCRWKDAGFSKVFFVDNIFNLPPGYAEKLSNRITEADLDLTWRAIIYPGRLTASLVKAMKHAGCVEVSLGFESGSENILHAMNKRFGREEIRTASRLFADHGIRQMGFLMLGGPGETRETVEESISFIETLPMDALKLTLGIRIYPNTDLAHTAVEQGLISAQDTLLKPAFYMVKDLEHWLRETVDALVSERPKWIY